MQPLRILHTESSTDLGGQEHRILSEAAGMARRGHTVILAADPESRLCGLAERQQLHVEAVYLKRTRFLQLVVDFLNIIRRNSIQIVNTHGSLDSWTASLAARLSSQRPIIIRARHTSIPIARTLLHRALYRWFPHGIVTTGESIRRQMISRQKIDQARIVSIPTGVDLDRYKPVPLGPALRAEFGCLPHNVLVGTVAFLRTYKGLEYFLGMAAMVLQKHPEVRFLIVGDGPDKTALGQKIRELGLSDYVILAGYREDIPNVLGALDLFVLSSVEAEGLPQALVQAMAMERPVVATTVGSISEVVEDQMTGLLARPRESRELGECILRLIRDKALRARIAQKGKERVVKEYTLDVMLDKTESFYTQLLRSVRPELSA